MTAPSPPPDPNAVIFDRHARNYSAEIEQAFGPFAVEHEFFIRHKAETIRDILHERWRGDLSKLHLIDVGCGLGLMHRYLANAVGEINGVDVSEESIRLAQAANPNVRYRVNEGTALPFDDATFDCLTLVCVLHHVPVAERTVLYKEVVRVLRPGGLAIAIEHNPYNPATQWIVRRCPIDEEAVLLSSRSLTEGFRGAGLGDVRTRYLLFTPFAAAPFRRLDSILGWLPLGAQYVTVGTRTP